MAVLLGFVLVAAIGIAHEYGLLADRAIKPNSSARTQAAITAAFLGFLALHTPDIMAFRSTKLASPRMEILSSFSHMFGEIGDQRLRIRHRESAYLVLAHKATRDMAQASHLLRLR